MAFAVLCFNLMSDCREVHIPHNPHRGQLRAPRTLQPLASSSCLCDSIANLFQLLIKTPLIPPPQQFHLTNHFLHSSSSKSRGFFFFLPPAAPTMINRCRWSMPPTTCLLEFCMAHIARDLCLPTPRGDRCIHNPA